MSLEIEDFTKSMTFTDFQNDRQTVKAVLSNLAIIGEATGNLLPEVEIIYPEIPWIDIRGIRNIVVHDYFRVNLEIIWENIKIDIATRSDGADLRFVNNNCYLVTLI